jgi:hypothetical protein
MAARQGPQAIAIKVPGPVRDATERCIIGFIQCGNAAWRAMHPRLTLCLLE